MDSQTLKKCIGKNLQKMRKNAGYSSAVDYATHLEWSSDTYTGYEQGRIALPLEKAWIIADDLDCTIDELVGHEVIRACTFQDPRQEKLNGCYESLNDESKTEVAGMVASIAADPARRIEKEGQEPMGNERAVGAA